MFRSIGIIAGVVFCLALPCGAAEEVAKDKTPEPRPARADKAPAKGKAAARSPDAALDNNKGNNDKVVAEDKRAERKLADKNADKLVNPGAPGAPEVDAPSVDDGLWLTNHSVRMRRDGNVPGQLRTVDASGELVPVHARLSFLHDGEIVGKALAEKDGFFQAVGLHQGIYDVVAVGRDTFGAFSLKVSPMAEPPAPSKAKSISYRDGGAVGMSEEERWEHLILSSTVLPAIDLFKAGQVIAYRIESFRLPGGSAPKDPTSRMPAPRNTPEPRIPGTPTGLPTLGVLLKSARAPIAITPAA
ncbi:MAG TPA: hypothetical protein VHV77_03855, partial [Pirellulales bacterium]|nr:hypothetical protein [Pirellulales bacterium]